MNKKNKIKINKIIEKLFEKIIFLKDLCCLLGLIAGLGAAICLLFVLVWSLFTPPVYEYNYASINLPNGKVIEGKVSSYEKCGGRYENDIEVKLSNGQKFYTEMSNVVLSKK